MISEAELGDEPGRWSVARDLVRACLGVITEHGFDDAVVAIGDPAELGAVMAATSQRARWMFDWEVVCGLGPGAEAWRTGRAIVVADLTTPAVSAMWPGWVSGAGERDVRSIAVVPVRVGSTVVGLFEAFSATPHPLDAAAIAGCARAAAAVARSLSALSAPAAGEGEVAPPLVRTLVHQAVGIVAARWAVSIDDATTLVRAHAFAHGTSIEAVAADVVAGRGAVTPA